MIQRTMLATAAAAVLAMPAFAQVDAGGMDIVETATRAGDFTTLLAAVEAADLVETLKGEGPYTLFAPTDDAFATLPGGTVEELLMPENRDLLIRVLDYHVVPGAILSADLSDGMTPRTVEGSTLEIRATDGVRVNDATVTQPDVAASNGVIHVIDTVLIPTL